MHVRYHILLSELRAAVPVGCVSNTPAPARAAEGFIGSLRYWQQLQGLVARYGLGPPAEEIFFFTRIKPHFTARIDYFILLYQSGLFCPPDPADIPTYLNTEATRYDRYLQQHAAFIGYYRSGLTDQHTRYFTNSANRHPPTHPGRVFDRNPECLSAGDPILAGLFAHTWYHRYLVHRIMQLQSHLIP